VARFERDDSLSRAHVEIRRRIAALPEFAEARELVLEQAFAECRGKSIPEMRELGGFSAVLERRIQALPARCQLNHGSQLIPYSVQDLLRAELASLRAHLQRRLANGEPYDSDRG